MRQLYIVSPIATATTSVAYAHDGEHVELIGSPFHTVTDYEEGMAQRVKNLRGEVYVVWEDELYLLCNPAECDGCWQCDNGSTTT